jgi:hypothetical protein
MTTDLPAQDTKPRARGEAAAAAGCKDLPGLPGGINRCVRGFAKARRIQTPADLVSSFRAISFPPGAKGETVMAKGQMRSNKEKKKPKADKNLKKGGAAPSPFASGKTPAGQNPGKKG